MLNPYEPRTLPGIENERAASELAAIAAVSDGTLPQHFPIPLWVQQSERYRYYWSWFRGDILNELKGYTEDHQPVLMYPLRINPIRNFARKHAALLFGEVPDTPTPMVKTVVKPVQFIEDSPTESEKKQAFFYQAFLNRTWTQSKGRSLQLENGILSQGLGGSVFQVKYQPKRRDLLIPLTVHNIYPDFFLPVWASDDYWNLLEAWVVYRVPAAVVQQQFGVESQMPTSLFVEHWTRDRYSIRLDGKPLSVRYGDKTVTYDERPHPYGKVPFTYIPRLREGNLYGSSMIEDVADLGLEYNSRMADLGDAVKNNVHVKWLGYNIHSTPRPRDFDGSEQFIDLGNENPAFKNPPSLEPQQTGNIPDSLVKFTEDTLWNQMLRDASLGPIAFGEDEGSQRSALTLAFRMWPSTAIAKEQRTFWTDGLNHTNGLILDMAAALGLKVKGQSVDRDWALGFDLAPDWLPMIPRDREAQVNEIILRLQENAISIESALEQFGDIPYVQEEVNRIKEWLEFKAKTESTQQGADQDLETPTASTGLKD